MIELCMSTMCIDSSTLWTKLDAIAKAGFQSVELWFKDQGLHKPFEIKKYLKDLGLKVAEVVKIEGWYELDGSLMGVDNNEMAIFDECYKRMEFAKKLDCPYIIALPSRDDRGHFASWGEGSDRYQKLLEIGEQFDVSPTLEFIGQSSDINTIQKASKFIQQFEHPLASLVVDVFHLWRGGGTIEDFRSVPKLPISLLHLHDASKQYPRDQYRDRHRVMPGDGILDLNGFLKVAKEKNFSGAISLGAYNHSFWRRDPYEVCREGMEKMTAVLGQVFN